MKALRVVLFGVWPLFAGMLLTGVFPQDAAFKGFWEALGYYEGFSSMALTDGGGYIVAGRVQYSTDGLLTKLDNSGKHLWTKRMPRFSAADVRPTRDGGFAVAGAYNSPSTDNDDAAVVLLDSKGAVRWAKTVGTGADENFSCLDQTSDEGFILVGHVYIKSEGSHDLWAVRLSSKGEILWQKRIGGKKGDYSYSVQQTSDGGYIVAAYTMSFGTGGAEGWCLKLSASGTLLWQKTFGGDSIDIFSEARQNADGSYIVIGSTDSYGLDAGATRDLWCLKLDASGNVLWQFTYGSAEDDFGRSIRPLKDGGYIAAGCWGRRCWGLKLSASGGVKWSRAYGTEDDDMELFEARPLPAGGYAFAGLFIGDLKVGPVSIVDGVLVLRSGPDGYIKNTCAELTEATHPAPIPSRTKPRTYAVRMLATAAKASPLSLEPVSEGFVIVDVCASSDGAARR